MYRHTVVGVGKFQYKTQYNNPMPFNCQKRRTEILFSAVIPWPFMMGVQVHHPWWESIVVFQFLPAMSLQAMRSWFSFILMVVKKELDSKWNTIQQVNKSNQVITHKIKIILTIMEIDTSFLEYYLFLSSFIFTYNGQNCHFHSF